jgi:hypothetical protein
MRREIYPDLADLPGTDGPLWNRYQARVAAMCAEEGLRSESVPVRTGDTILWHPELPHAGGEIFDYARTRHSLVCHVTPVGVPVYHYEKFFNPRAAVPGDAAWGFLAYEGRGFVRHDAIDVGHKQLLPLSALS